MDSDEDILEVSRRLSESLRPGDLDTTLEHITRAAVDVLPSVDFASITVKHDDGELTTSAPTDPSITDLDAAQYTLQEGPCYEAATDTVHVTAPHLATDPRFPRYGPVAVSVGIEAQAAIRLFDGRESNGALNLYSRRPGSLADLEILGQLFAHHSAVALAYARQVSQLQEAIQTRQLIGQAVGVAMERFDLDDARAFAFLTRLSQDNNIKVRVIAERMLNEANRRALEH